MDSLEFGHGASGCGEMQMSQMKWSQSILLQANLKITVGKVNAQLYQETMDFHVCRRVIFKAHGGRMDKNRVKLIYVFTFLIPHAILNDISTQAEMLKRH